VGPVKAGGKELDRRERERESERFVIQRNILVSSFVDLVTLFGCYDMFQFHPHHSAYHPFCFASQENVT